MTPEAQRIAIAEACGWKRVTGESVQCPAYAFILIDPNNFQVAWTHSSVTALTKYLPDYLNDLNAMHEAEKILTHKQRIDHMEWLGMCSDDYGSEVWAYVHADAAQRADALLRTIGRWEEEAKL